ncbi:MAG: trigger factor [Clostridiales bacterium]|jgi:trigger factor|nr:trigger factor [Clostridiales bacterium]
MGVQIEELENSRVKLGIEVGPDRLEEEIAKAFKRSMKRFSVPGFRKGKAPQGVVERYYGRDILLSDALEALCYGAYEEAVEENGIRPVDRPEIDIDMDAVSRGEPVRFSMTVTVMPKAALGKYKGVEVSDEKVYVTDADIDEELKRQAERNARLVPVEDRPSQEGDSLLIDYEGSVGGVPFEGGKADGHSLELGKKTFIPGFEEQLVGRNAEDKVEVSVTFPDDYNEESLKGKDAVFSVYVRAIKRKELPEIDDDFAQDVSEFDTLGELKEDIRKRLQAEQEQRAKSRFENGALDAVIKEMDAKLPDVLLKRRTDYNYREFARMMGAGDDIAAPESAEQLGEGMRQFYDSIRERSERELKAEIALEQVADAESIGVSDEEVDAGLRAMFEARGQDYDKQRGEIPADAKESYRGELRNKKALEFIVSNAVKV